ASLSIAPGSSQPTTISTQVTVGSAQSVALSATNLPVGVTASFNPPTITSGGSSTLTLIAAGNAPGDTTTITITGTGTSTTHTTGVGVVVGDGGSGVTNGGFESGLSGWTASGESGTASTTATNHT